MTHLDPRIGILNSGIHYAFVNGYDQPEVRGTRTEVEVALGLRPAQKAVKALRQYEVTVTPEIDMWAGTVRQGAYTTEVWALTHNEAITMVRRARRDEEGRFAVKVKITAKRVVG